MNNPLIKGACNLLALPFVLVISLFVALGAFVGWVIANTTRV